MKSSQFLGVAEMISDVSYDESFAYWWEPLKWFGLMKLKWIYVKDIHVKHFEHIQEYSYLSLILYICYQE